MEFFMCLYLQYLKGFDARTAGFVLLCFITASTPVFLIILLLILTGTGFGFFLSPNSRAIMSSVEKSILELHQGMSAQ